jgi:NAD+ synthase (glutamine-hydrolysing)
MRRLRIALAQINAVVGDLNGNAAKILRVVESARGEGAQLVAFPELALTGYPPEDLVLKPNFIADNLAALRSLAREIRGITAVVGFVDADSDIYNAAAVLHHDGTAEREGEIALVYRKQYLPNYGVFDEQRYFRAGRESPIFTLDGVVLGVNICEDMWYPNGPTTAQAAAGAEVIVNINASPYHLGKREYREKMLATRAADNGIVVAYTNLVGGQDELVFDGRALIFDQSARLVAAGPQFVEDLLIADLDVEAIFRTRLHDPRRRQAPVAPPSGPVVALHSAGAPASTRSAPIPCPPLAGPAEVYAALVLGTRDYVRKNGFSKVLIGLSGGIDSSLVAAIAADALGSENVVGVSMPSRYSSDGSKTDAALLAEALGIELLTVPIEPAFEAMLGTLADQFAGTAPGLAEENLQARIRGNILMALSNKFGHLVLTTGNKSEMATGYSTLYGDMSGGFAVIKDVPKMLVYELSRHRNARGPVIPPAVLTKPPSAELRPDQRDDDSLPPYPLLDAVLEAYVEEDRSPEELVARGFDAALVRRVARLVDRSEYKRRQAAPGIKITPRAFGRDRRLPITDRYTGDRS